jgi:hypothetical protein
MRRWWRKLRIAQKKIVICVLVIIFTELTLWGSILLGRGLQQIFWLQCKAWVKQGERINGVPYADLINTSGARYYVDPALVAAIIRCESNFEPRALSKAGAMGLMQICLPTWRDLKQGEAEWRAFQSPEEELQALYQPHVNIPAGTKYLQMMLTHYRGDVVKAVAAYNAGLANVDRYKGLPPYAETRRYVHHVITVWMEYRGLKNEAVTCYRWGRRMETLGLQGQGYLLMVCTGGLFALVTMRLVRWRSKRRW